MRSFWVGKHFANILDSESSLKKGSKSFLYCFLLGFIVVCGFEWIEKWVEIRICSLWACKLIFSNLFLSLLSMWIGELLFPSYVRKIYPNLVNKYSCYFLSSFLFLCCFGYACGVGWHLYLNLYVVFVVAWDYLILLFEFTTVTTTTIEFIYFADYKLPDLCDWLTTEGSQENL